MHKKHQSRCPLCNYSNIEFYFEDKFRHYLHCPVCDLVFVPSEFHLSPEAEKTRYDLHNNNPKDPGYQKFLSRLSNPLLQELSTQQSGLDFGCGPGPALAQMMEKAGHKMKNYDPLYCPNPTLLAQTYDFICATEVVEHFREPGKEFKNLFKLLNSGGMFAIMTKLVSSQEAFRSWHYIRDETHIAFYSKNTFETIAEHYNYQLSFPDKDVIFLKQSY